MPTRRPKPASRRPASRRRRRPNTERAARAFVRLVEVMAALRSRHGCPWDLRQTHRSLRPYLIEEAYEVLEAIDHGDDKALRGELGDVLLQCVFHAQIATEAGHFEIADVVDGLVAKLVNRHPHVLNADGTPLSAGDRRRLGSSGEVVEQWARIKARERAATGAPGRVLAGVPRALPALARAERIGARVAAVGFDWPAADGVLDKLEEEVAELRAAVGRGRARTLDEMGDVLFTMANLSRKLGIDPEDALARANDKFTRRFDRVERHLQRQGTNVHATSPEALENAWQAIKTPARRAPSRTRRSRSGR